ncbi:ABC transporter permease [Salana multivorans]
MSAPAGQPHQLARILAYTRFEAIGMLRNGEQLLVAVVLPALALLGLGAVDVVRLPGAESPSARLDVIAPGVLALAIVSSSFTSQAIATAFDRRWGVLRQLSTTPLGPSGIVAGKAVAVLAVQVLQVLLLAGLALALGWRPQLGAVWAALLAWWLGSLCFTALGLLVAGRLRAEAVLAVANLAWVAFAALGGLVLPTTGDTPVPVPVMAWLPSGALGDALRETLGNGTVPGLALAVLAAWTVLTSAAAARWFQPSE